MDNFKLTSYQLKVDEGKLITAGSKVAVFGISPSSKQKRDVSMERGLSVPYNV